MCRKKSKIKIKGEDLVPCGKLVKSIVLFAEGGDETSAEAVVVIVIYRDILRVEFRLALKAVGDAKHKPRMGKYLQVDKPLLGIFRNDAEYLSSEASLIVAKGSALATLPNQYTTPHSFFKKMRQMYC